MTKKRKKKHVPQRTCVGCRTVQPKQAMTRIVRTKDSVQIDPSGKLAGRGAYLHDKRTCWQKGLQSALAHALKTNISAEDRQKLREYMESLPNQPQA